MCLESLQPGMPQSLDTAGACAYHAMAYGQGRRFRLGCAGVVVEVRLRHGICMRSMRTLFTRLSAHESAQVGVWATRLSAHESAQVGVWAGLIARRLVRVCLLASARFFSFFILFSSLNFYILKIGINFNLNRESSSSSIQL